MLSYGNCPPSCTEYYWFDERYKLWHPVDVLHKNKSDSLYWVQRMETWGILNYIPREYMWVEPRSLTFFDYNPNELFTPRMWEMEYYKSIHPYMYALTFDFKCNDMKIKHKIKNEAPKTVYILLFIICH